MYSNNKLSKAVRLAIAFGAASAFAGTAVAQDAQQEEEAAKVERIEVTGSRIKRTDLEGALPVTVIDREMIDMSGQLSVSDLLRGTTFNSTGSFRPQSGSSAQGTASINLRGLGSDRTLVLVDGRRLPKSPSTGDSQDLNSIPIGAVERIEILSDGASAMYGSDAMGGVVNIITRKDFNGVEFNVSMGEASVPKEGGDTESGSVVFGSSNAKTSLIGGVSWNKRDIVFERDYPWVVPGSSVYGNNWINADFTGNFSAIPGGCSEENFIATTISGEPRCQYNFNATNANEASTRNESMFIKARHQVTDDWQVYMNASATKSASFGRYAPAPDWAPVSATSVNNPTNPNAWFYNPANPNAVPFNPAIGAPREIEIYHRYAALGNRDGYVNNEGSDFLVGAQGMLGNVDLDFGVRRNRSKTYDIGYNYIVRSTAWDYIERGIYDLQRPSANDEDVLNAMKATISRISFFNQDEAYISGSFDMFEVAAGMVQGVLGAEYRKEDYQDQYDSLSEAGQIGGSAGNSAGGDRSVKSAFFETLVPILDNLEMSLAGRYDKYSDYGNDFAPKVSFRFEPMDGLVMRASWGQGFRAPTLPILTQKTTFSAVSVNDAQTCAVLGSCPVQVDTFIRANPNLSSEQSDQYTVGLAYQPTDWLNFSVDYWNTKITNKITYFGPATILDRLASGDSLPAGIGITRRSNGSISEVLAGYGNEGEVNTDGIDFNARTNFDFGAFGRLNQNLQIAYTRNYDEGGRNFVKDPGFPQMRATLQNVYVYGDIDVAYNLNLIGNSFRCGLGQTPGGAANRNGCVNSANAPRDGNWGTYVTHDLQVSYNLPWDGKITVGALNIFEKLPSLRPYGGRDYNFDLYDGWGRQTYVRYSQSF
ncbi:TonB-dependent siderophore receptor [Alishewanella sp. HH-ZS]|uniref:TonB-dependent receptor plug domain-containing protein n=1 Tax=Alishewanella sp. HH-ZS TaxID=1856684 RepID=UPI0008236F5C|nr:TonB-dependent receptor [Alishewanella sp. HH-ZS]OCW97097.1 TonB-dependent receptor [Alishewanella sp. HH-ZS]